MDGVVLAAHDPRAQRHVDAGRVEDEGLAVRLDRADQFRPALAEIDDPDRRGFAADVDRADRVDLEAFVAAPVGAGRTGAHDPDQIALQRAQPLGGLRTGVFDDRRHFVRALHFGRDALEPVGDFGHRDRGALDVAGDHPAGLELALDRGRDQLGGAADPVDRLGDRIDRRDGVPGRALDLGDEPADPPGRARGLVGERAHLARDQREAEAFAAGARRLDAGVDREQPGLARDMGDEAGDVVDLGRDIGERRDRRARGAGRRHRLVRGRLGVADLIGHADHRAGELPGRGRRRAHRAERLARTRGHPAGRPAEAVGGVAHLGGDLGHLVHEFDEVADGDVGLAFDLVDHRRDRLALAPVGGGAVGLGACALRRQRGLARARGGGGRCVLAEEPAQGRMGAGERADLVAARGVGARPGDVAGGEPRVAFGERAERRGDVVPSLFAPGSVGRSATMISDRLLQTWLIEDSAGWL